MWSPLPLTAVDAVTKDTAAVQRMAVIYDNVNY